MKIGTCRAERGRLAHGKLSVPQLSDVVLPIAIAQGEETGKTAFLSAGMHGDEVNGIEVLRRFMHALDASVLRGTVIFLPLINIGGFRTNQRTVPLDGKDLNRCFPGDAGGTPSERMAHTIFHEVIARCDFGIDVHDSGQGSVLLPHPRAHIRDVSGGYSRERMAEIAVFGTDIIMLTRGMGGVMTIEAGRHLGIPAFTVEIGGAMILWEGFIQRALAGLRNVLISKGMMDGEVILPHYQFIIPGEDDIALPAPTEGILHVKTSLGWAVNRGDILAEIFNPITRKQAILRANRCGIVHDLNVHAKVNAGDDVVGVLEFVNCPERGRKPGAENVEVLVNEAMDGIVVRPSELFEQALKLQIAD